MYRNLTPDKCAQRFQQLLDRIGYVAPSSSQPPAGTAALRASTGQKSNLSSMNNNNGSILADESGNAPTWKQWEWLFAEHAFPDRNAGSTFLLWLCDNLTMNNIITKDQLAEFEELVKMDAVLDGQILEEALSSSSLAMAAATATAAEDKSLGQLQDELDTLQQELCSIEQRLERKKQQRDLMQRSLEAKRSSLNTAARQNTKRREEATQEIKKRIQIVRNHELNQVLEKLNLSIKTLMNLFSSVQQGSDHFFASTSLQEYVDEDTKFTKQLVEFSSKQFEVQRQVRRLEDEQDNDPDTMALVQGLTSVEYNKYSKELERLKMAYRLGEEQQLIALVELAKAKAELEKVKKQCDYVVSYQQMDLRSLCERIEQVNAESQRYKTFLGECMQTIPALIKEIADYHTTSVLEGSYDLKLARQDYHLAKQDRVLDHLLSQKSRHEFLIKCLAQEHKRIQYVHNLLEAVQSEVETMCSSLNKRMQEYSRLIDASIDSSRQSQDSKDMSALVIPSSDTLMKTLHEIASSNTAAGAQQQQLQRSRSTPVLPYTTYGELLQKLDNIVTQKQSTENDIKFIEDRTDAHVQDTLDRYRTLEQTLFGKSATYLQPQLLPRNVEQAIRELETKESLLEAQIKGINDRREQKIGAETRALLQLEKKQFVKRIMQQQSSDDNG